MVKHFRMFIRRLCSILSTEQTNLRYASYHSQAAQRQLFLNYQQIKLRNLPLPRWEEVGFRVFSQNDEDGLLLYIFALIGTTNKMCLDISFASPFGANTTNLICNWGWNGLLVCADEPSARSAQNFFSTHKDTHLYPPKAISSWVTAENINDLIKDSGIEEEIDLFSLDIDGVDYWVWKAMSVIKPRVVVVEYQDIWGPDKSVTVPYRPDFNRYDTHEHYCGASLPAFVKLAHEKGYRLVGVNRYGFNAFFVRRDIGENDFPEISVQSCFKHPIYKQGVSNVLPQIKHFEWIEV